MLGLRQASRAFDDRELLLAAYVKWGTRCASYLLGEFAFAIWDEGQKRLFCCSDHIGFRAFLYWHNQNRFVFAGDINLIYTTTGALRQLNRPKLAALTVPTAHLTRHEETFHYGILSLPPGVCMTVDHQGVRQQRYWEPSLEGGPPVPRRADDAYEALRNIFFKAVECRLDRDGPVAALLSGGLDSSSVVATAAKCLQSRNRGLTAISAVLPDESRTRFADERQFITEFRSWENIDLRFVTASGRGPFDTLHDLSRFEIHPLRTSRFYVTEECETEALAIGAGALLWGFGGEMGATSWSERYYLEMAIRLRLATLFRELRRRRAFDSTSGIRILARQLYRVMVPIRGQTRSVFLTAQFQRECQEKPALRTHRFTQRAYQLDNLRFWLSKHGQSQGNGFNLIRPTFPMLDKRVLEFCLALPACLDVRDGYQRYPLRKALDGLLPPKIQWRTDKLPFAPDYFVRYNTQLRIAKEFVAAIRPNDPVRSVIDVDRVSSLLKPVDPVVGSIPARDQIPATLYTINFLRQFADFRP